MSLHLTAEEKQDLEKNTHFTRVELKTLYKKFKDENPNGFITKATLIKSLELMGLKPDTFMAQRVFSVYDKNGDGVIDFKECVAFLSVLAKGTQEEKIEFSFHLYDENGDGRITKLEFRKMISSLAKTKNMTWDANKITEQFFAVAHQNKENEITLDEFKKYARTSDFGQYTIF